MRGADSHSEKLVSTIRLEEFVPANHPLRPIRAWMNETPAKMDERFSAKYEADVRGGRPSIAPEKLMRAMLLQVLFSIRSERQLVEQINYNVLFRWFVGLSIDDAVWNHSVISKNRDRLIEHEVAAQTQADVASTAQRKTVAADKAYDTKGFVKACRELDVTPHLAQNLNRLGGSAIDGRATRHAGYAMSMRARKRIEQCFGWAKTVGQLAQVMVPGLDKLDQLLTLTMAAYNLTRLRTLAPLRPQVAQ